MHKPLAFAALLVAVVASHTLHANPTMRVLTCKSTVQSPQGPITSTGTVLVDIERSKRLLHHQAGEVPMRVTPTSLSWTITNRVPGEGVVTISEVLDRKTGVLSSRVSHTKDGRELANMQEQSLCTGL